MQTTAAEPITTQVAPRTLAIHGMVGLVLGSTFGVALLIAGIIVLARTPEWWTSFIAASMVALLNAAASMAVLRRANGRTIEQGVGIVYLVAGARLAVSLVGCLIAVKVGHYSPQATGLMIVSYYVAMLIAESIVLARAVSAKEVTKAN